MINCDSPYPLPNIRSGVVIFEAIYLAEAFALSSKTATYQGALIASILPNSSADQAGLKIGDIIISAGNRRITSAIDIQNRIGLSVIGEHLPINYIRRGQEYTVDILISPIPIPEAKGAMLSPYLSGTELIDLIPSDQEESVGISVKSLNRNSKAAQLGFEEGDIIFGVNRTRVHSIEELKNYLNQRQAQAFKIRRGYEDFIIYIR